MEENYIVAYTIFGIKYGGFKTRYEHFNSLEQAKNFVKFHASIKNNYMIYKSIKENK